MTRIMRALTVLLLAVAASAVAPTAPAHAIVQLLVCSGAETARFQPPITNVPQQTTVTTTRNYAPCVALHDPLLLSGRQSGSHPRTLSCFTLLGGGAREFTVEWSTGETSTFKGTTITNIVGVSIVNVTTGTVTAGLFKGAAFEHTVTSPALSITLCTLTGAPVDSLSGLIHLVINGVG